MSNGFDSIVLERAKFVRDVEYIREGVKDDAMQDYIDSVYEFAEGKIYTGADIDEEIMEAEEIDEVIDNIPVDDADEAKELQRIVSSDEDIDIDTMLGLADDVNNIDSDDTL